ALEFPHRGTAISRVDAQKSKEEPSPCDSFYGGEPMVEIGHFIGGRRVAGRSGRSAEFFKPMTGEVQGTVALASAEEVRQAVLDAAAAQPAWAAQNPQRRARVLIRFLDLVRKEFDSLAEMLALEHGKTIPDARGD